MMLATEPYPRGAVGHAPGPHIQLPDSVGESVSLGSHVSLQPLSISFL